MSSELELLGARKALLVTRVSLQRLQITNEMNELRESLRWRRAAASVGSRPVLSVVVAAGLFFLARRHIGQAARWAGLALAALRIVQGFTRR
jgi:hypothetical protein